MPSAYRISNALAQALLGVYKTQIDSGTAAVIEIYGDTIPADVETAVGAQTKLATLTMSSTAFGTVSDANPGAIMTAAAITPDSSADDTDTATWFRISTQSGGTALIQGSVGTNDEDIVFNTVAFTAGSEISITSLSITQPESAS